MRRVAVFARRPVVGKVKTRLSPALPPEMACVLYEGMLADAVAAVRGSRLAEERYVYWAEAGSVGEAEGLVEREQAGGDLGERLIAAFNELIVKPGDHAVIIGADCPMLDSRVIDEAFERLEEFERRAETGLVIAPTRDGGYALIGLTRPVPGLFRGIEWGTEHVLGQTLDHARQERTGTASLSWLDDVDTPTDTCSLIANLQGDVPAAAPRTRLALRSCRLIP